MLETRDFMVCAEIGQYLTWRGMHLTDINVSSEIGATFVDVSVKWLSVDGEREYCLRYAKEPEAYTPRGIKKLCEDTMDIIFQCYILNDLEDDRATEVTLVVQDEAHYFSTSQSNEETNDD